MLRVTDQLVTMLIKIKFIYNTISIICQYLIPLLTVRQRFKGQQTCKWSTSYRILHSFNNPQTKAIGIIVLHADYLYEPLQY